MNRTRPTDNIVTSWCDRLVGKKIAQDVERSSRENGDFVFLILFFAKKITVTKNRK